MKCEKCGSPAFRSINCPDELDVCDKYPKCNQSIREQVAEFHAAMNQKDPATPTVPPDDRVRLRAALIAEEFFETMEAMFPESELIDEARDALEHVINKSSISVNMVELADGIADLNYVTEGTYLEFGIDSGSIAAEVHRSNMAKFVGEPVWAPNGKRLKPVGWMAPDIAGELKKQGWKP